MSVGIVCKTDKRVLWDRVPAVNTVADSCVAGDKW